MHAKCDHLKEIHIVGPAYRCFILKTFYLLTLLAKNTNVEGSKGGFPDPKFDDEFESGFGLDGWNRASQCRNKTRNSSLAPELELARSPHESDRGFGIYSTSNLVCVRCLRFKFDNSVPSYTL